VAQRALRLGDREADEQPRVRPALGARAGEDPRVAGLEDRPAGVREPVARRAVAALGGDDAAALQPRHRRAHRLLVEVEAGHEADEVGDRDPPAQLAHERAEEGHQQRPGPGGVGDRGHGGDHSALTTIITEAL
jgi:hypothetical protein